MFGDLSSIPYWGWLTGCALLWIHEQFRSIPEASLEMLVSVSFMSRFPDLDEQWAIYCILMDIKQIWIFMDISWISMDIYGILMGSNDIGISWFPSGTHVQKTMELHHVEWETSLEMTIFNNSYI